MSATRIGRAGRWLACAVVVLASSPHAGAGAADGEGSEVEAPSGAATLWRDGAPLGPIDAGDARRAGLFVVDLGDDWVPRLFRGTDYEGTFRALANEALEGGPEAARAERDRYLEVYGIPPSLGVLRARFLETRRSRCRERLSPAPLLAFPGAPIDAETPRAAVSKHERIPRFQRALAAAQERLICDGHLRGRVTGRFDAPTRAALGEFERRHRIYARARFDGPTLEALRTPPLELEREALVRVITERVVLTEGLLEDGSAERLDEAGSEPAADLVGEAEGRIVRAFGLETAEGAARFYFTDDLEGHHLVAFEGVPRPDYEGDDMDLRVEIDRGDVWYERPFDNEGRPIRQPIEQGPTLTLFVRDGDRARPLVRYRTTIGGWRVLEERGREVLRYMESPVGSRVWSEIVSGPVWMPPMDYPDESLITTRPGDAGGDAKAETIDRNLIGPSYASAYGLVAAYHRRYARKPSGALTLLGDEGIRTHGSSDYTSPWHEVSLGCHRLRNHLALRLFTFILAAVFIPVAFAGGITGRLYQQFALTIAISVLLSALNALTLSPALCAKWLKPRKRSRGPLARFFGLFDRLFDRTTNGYLRIVQLTTRRLLITLLVLAAFVVATFFLGRQTKTGFVPAEDQGYIFGNFSLPEAASLERTRAAMRKVEDLLADTPGVHGYTSVAGYNILAGASAPYYGLVFISLEPWDERTGPGEDLESIVAHLNAGFAEIPELRGVATPPPGIPGLGTTGGFSLYLQDLSGDLSPQELAEQIQRFVAAANERPELANVLSPFRASVPQKRALVNESRALRQGLPLEQVYGTLASFLGGRFINQFNRFGRTWNVYMQAKAEYRADEEGIELFYIRSRDGGMSPISTVVDLVDSTGPQFMNRFNLYSAAYVLGSAAPGYSSGQAIEAVEAVAADVLPRTMGYEWTDLSRQQVEAASVVPVFALALVSVLLILAALYESWSLPYAVLLGTPIAMAGAFAGLVIRDLEFDVYGQIGLIMLVGLSAKNAILIVEYARAEYERGVPLLDAALDAGRIRLRPIIMTSFAFILGCVPLWVASGAGAEARKILGTVVIVGMLFSTLVATLIVPALFVFVERVVARVGRRGKRGRGDDATKGSVN